jgi:hypothetical protein
MDKLLAYKLRLEELIESALGDKQLQQLIASRFEAVVSENFTSCNNQMVRLLIQSFQADMEEEGGDKLSWEILRLNPSLDLCLELYRTRLVREVLINPRLNLQRHCGFI